MFLNASLEQVRRPRLPVGQLLAAAVAAKNLCCNFVRLCFFPARVASVPQTAVAAFRGLVNVD